MGTNRATQSILNWKDYCAGKIWGLGLHPLSRADPGLRHRQGRKPPATATPRNLWAPRQSSTLPVWAKNPKFVRGKQRSREEIERFVLSDYELTIPYENDKDLDDTLYEILQEAFTIADTRNGFIEADVIAQDGPERYW